MLIEVIEYSAELQLHLHVLKKKIKKIIKIAPWKQKHDYNKAVSFA